VLLGAKPLFGALGPFLEQLNPVLGWLSLHQHLISDFISNGGTSLAAKTTSLGGSGVTCGGVPCGHYLRQFGPTGPETLGIYTTRDKANRGNTYPAPLWLVDPQNLQKGNFASWDCKNTGAPGDGSQPTSSSPPPNGTASCWVAPPLPGAAGQGQTPHITAAQYSSK
jgi:hypothetical protein